MMFSDRSGDYDGETNSDCSAMFSLWQRDASQYWLSYQLLSFILIAWVMSVAILSSESCHFLSGVWRNGEKCGQEASGYEDHEEACGQECCKEKAVSTSCC